MNSNPAPTRRLTPELLAIILIVVAYVAWLLSMPAWPSQDGPVHLYYTRVLGALMSHSNSAYVRYFAIKHVLPPYALYYYGLLALSTIFRPLLADRLIVCVYVISFVFGFRYLARALGPSADTATLLATALILNWPLGMGFVNFCLSLSFAFWAIGLWMRFADRVHGAEGIDLRRRVEFVLLAIVIMLTHPVPLSLVVIVCLVLLTIDRFRKERPAAFGRDVVTLAVASLTLVYVKLFATSHPLEQIEPTQGSFLVELANRVLRYAREDGVVLVFGHSLTVYVYRVGIGVLLILPIVLGIRQRLRNRAARLWTKADTMLVLGLLLLVLLPLIPPQINGLFYFADRMPLLVWITLLSAASGVVALAAQRQSVRALVIAFAILTNAALLFASETILRPIARSIAAVESTPVTLSGQLGFIMEDPRPPASVVNGPSWNPYYWASIHVLRHNDAILANAPWMNETILPVGATEALPERSIPALRTPQPTHVYGALASSPQDLRATLNTVGFFVVTQAGRQGDGSAGQALVATDPAARTEWTCQVPMPGWYSLCQKANHADGEQRR